MAATGDASSEPDLGRDPAAMHEWTPGQELLAHTVIGFAIERLHLSKDPRWGARSAADLERELTGVVSETGIGGVEALRLFREVLLPACRPLDDPMMLSYVPGAPSVAATLFDLVVSACSVFAGHWESGAGAIAAENQALRWLADLAGFPPQAAGVFVSGGSAANLSALVTARHVAAQGRDRPARWRVAVSDAAHASVDAAARVMDVDVVRVAVDDADRMTADALRQALDADPAAGDGVFAVVASAGTTNAGAVDDLAGLAQVCAERDLWLHVDGAYGGAALCAPSARPALAGIERADSFGVDPHKWLFVPYDCAALVYRDPASAVAAHAQHGAYLDGIDRGESNPADLAFHLSRRARGLPLWFALATYGTDAYRAAVEASLATARWFAAEVARRPALELVIEPELSVVLFRRRGWTADDCWVWSATRAKEGIALVVPTTWRGEAVLRVCITNPRTTADHLALLLDDIERHPGAAAEAGFS
ncbi:MAG TPA: aminotransferase class I/II-fold pyridoxal phosphate-dependent enzyme [Acidimicrobiales bacterium]|nr:aminotransferase class I/II-fold pyridoxal phosphate-dependent enzyme [Acidimicrobiales bacterium]